MFVKSMFEALLKVITFAGFEISDVLRISDKDYSVTFGLYFSVEWLEPRLNLSRDQWGEGRVASEQELIPGAHTTQYTVELQIRDCEDFTIKGKVLTRAFSMI